MDINQFVANLQNPGFRPGSQEKKQLATWGQTLDAGKDSLNQDARSVLLQALKQGAQNSDPFLKCFALSLRSVLGGDSSDLEHAIAALAKGMGSIEDQIAALNSFTSLLWSDGPGAKIAAAGFPRNKQRRYWKNLIAKVRILAKSNGVLMSADDMTDGRIVITTQQLLGPSHAPTRDTFEFTRLLTAAGFEVLIIASREFNSEPAGALAPARTSNVNEAFNGPVRIEYRGQHYQSYQPSQGTMNDASLIEIFSRIKSFGPELILSVGTRSVVAETLAGSGPMTLMYPTTSGVPLTLKNHFMMWRAPTEGDLALMEDEGLRDQFLFWRHPGFEPPETKGALSRSDFDIRADAFVILIVGQRLHDDIDEAFIEFMRALCTANERFHFVFAGHFHTYEALFSEHSDLAGRWTYIGFHSDIMAINALGDVYVNPRRAGGGSAIVYAMAAGLPAFTMPFGDAYEAARSLPRYESYEDIAAAVTALESSPGALEGAKALALSTAEGLTSRQPFVDDIITALHAFKAGTLEPWNQT